jgi:hypothetical protein
MLYAMQYAICHCCKYCTIVHEPCIHISKCFSLLVQYSCTSYALPSTTVEKKFYHSPPPPPPVICSQKLQYIHKSTYDQYVSLASYAHGTSLDFSFCARAWVGRTGCLWPGYTCNWHRLHPGYSGHAHCYSSQTQGAPPTSPPSTHSYGLHR